MSFRSFARVMCAAVLVGALGAVAANAATIQMSLQYVGSLDSDAATPIGTPLVDDPSSILPNQYHQFSVAYTISGALANEDFQGLQFDVQLGPGFTPADFGGYIPDSPSFDPAGPLPNAAIYSSNSDGGADTNDLQRIIVIGNANANYLHGFRPGINGTGRIGDLYLQWDGSSDLDGKTGLALLPNGANPWGTYVGTNVTPQTADSFTGASLMFDVGPTDDVDPDIVPQVVNIDLDVLPNTIENLQLTATDNVTLPENLVWSGLLYAGPGKNHPASADPLLDADGVFNWNPAGWRQGAHLFSATVTDEAGNAVSELALTVNLIVPEPASFALVGLAMVGLVGVIRRR